MKVCLIHNKTLYEYLQAGIKNYDNVISGEEINQLSENELLQAADQQTLFTRMFPEAKLSVVNALRKNDEIVAMDFTNCSICFCSGDFTSLMLVSDCPILPSFVSFPIFSTLKTASPETVNVPLYTLLSSDELSLKTEKLSPVMEDSFTEKSLLRTITPSALMISPFSVSVISLPAS